MAPLLAPIAIIAAIWLATVCWRMAADVTVPWDAKNQFYAFFRFLATAIHSGYSPFWNPYHYGGHPAVADPQSLIFSPLFVLWALFDAAPSIRTFDLIVYFHLLAGGLAVVALGWRAGWPPAANVLAAMVFMFGAGAAGRIDHTCAILVYAMFPPALLLLQLAMQRRSIPLALAFAFVAAILALGRNQVALMMGYALMAVAAAEVATAERPVRYLAERAGVLAVMAGVGAAIVTIPSLLTMQFAALSNRPAIDLAHAYESSLHPVNLATLAMPNVLGSLTYGPWGPNYMTVPELPAVDESFNYLFVGAVPVILLLWFGVAGGGMWRHGRRVLAGVLVVSLCFMLGRYTPLFRLMFEWIPGVGFFRRPVDGSFVFLAALAILAGHLLADYIRDGVPRLRIFPTVLVAAGALAVLVTAVTFSARTGHGVAAFIEELRAVPVVVLAIALLAYARTVPARQWAAAGVVLIAVAELLWWNGASRLNAEPRANYNVYEKPTGAEAQTLALLDSAIRERHAKGDRPRVEIMGAGGPMQNVAVVRGLEAINGYNPLRIGIYDRLVAPGETTYLAEQRSFPGSFESYDSALARALGLEYVLLDRPIEQVPHLAHRPVADLMRDGPDLWLYRLHNPMPRLTFATRFQVADADSLGRRGELLAIPSSERVLFDDDTPPQEAYWSLPPGQAGTARIVAWRPDRIEIEVDSPLGGMLALHDTYYPGWVAEIDGKPARILRADILFRGLEVPAGHRRVVFRYAPFSLHNLADALGRALHRPQ